MKTAIARARVRQAVLAAAALVFVLAWTAYGAALAGDYVFDDFHSVAGNAALRDLGNGQRSACLNDASVAGAP